MIENTKLTFPDYILFIIIFILPYGEGGAWNWMYAIPFVGTAGPGFASFVLALFLSFISFHRKYRVRFKPLYYSVLAAACFSIIKLAQTISAVGMPEGVTIFRKSYVYIISFALIMRYIINLDNERIYLLGKLIFKSTVIVTLLYFAQCAGLPIFVEEIGVQSSQGIQVSRNIIGFPPVLPVILGLVFGCMIFTYERNYIILVVMLLLACMISYTRNFMFSGAAVMMLVILLFTIKYGLSRNYRLLLFILCGWLLIYEVAPTSLEFWNNHIRATIGSELEKGVGTYAFREHLIEKSILRITLAGEEWTGVGYIRDSAKGEYSLVLGSDTFIAPVLWCEGFLGLILRCVPLVILLVQTSYIYLRNKEQMVVLLSMVIIGSILSQIPLYVQTSIFMNYCFMFAQMMVIYTYIINYMNEYAES